MGSTAFMSVLLGLVAVGPALGREVKCSSQQQCPESEAHSLVCGWDSATNRTVTFDSQCDMRCYNQDHGTNFVVIYKGICKRNHYTDERVMP